MKETQAEKLETSVDQHQPEDGEVAVELDAGEGIEAGSPPESETPQTTPQTTETPQTPQPPDWMQTQPPQTVPDGVPIDSQGKRPSENTIDFDLLRQQLDPETFDEVERRFKGIYRQIKATDRMLSQLEHDNILLQEAESAQREAEAVKKRTSEISMALQDMDFDKAAGLMTEKETPPKTESPKHDPKLARTVKEFETEIDDLGNYTHPYMQQNHPLYGFAYSQTKALMDLPQLRNATSQEVLFQLDKIMQNVMNRSTSQQQAHTVQKAVTPEVLTGDPNIRTKSPKSKLQLSSEQKYTARRLFSNLKPQEAEVKYLNALKRLPNG
jgi:hypothetical protein